MRLYKVDEKSKAICPICNQIRTTTFKERDVPLSSGKGLVTNVLVAVCDTCDSVVSIPHQSTPRIQAVMRSSRHPIEARIPRHLLDALGLVCYELGVDTNDSKKTTLFRYYLQKISRIKRINPTLARLAESEEAQGKANARFSIKLNDEIYEIFQRLERETKLNKAELVKGIIIKIKRDILDEKKKNRRDYLKAALLAGG